MSEPGTDLTETIIGYRLERAAEALDDARLLAERGRWNLCTNRLYYACFDAVKALLLRHGMSSSKHTGVRALFSRSFVKPGLVAVELGDTHNRPSDLRQEADYADLARITEEQVRSWLPGAERFVAAVEQLVASDPAPPPS